jgi:hypothetical protein
MQYVLQKYTLYTCHENAQSGSSVMCFHPTLIYQNEPLKNITHIAT